MNAQSKIRHRRGPLGYTMVEVVTVLVVMAVAVSLAAPAIGGIVAANRPQRAMDRVTADLSLARLQAVRAGQRASFRIDSATAYTVTIDDPAGARTVKRVNLREDFPGLALSPSSGTATFDSRGLLVQSSLARITATARGKSASLTVSPVGRIFREY